MIVFIQIRILLYLIGKHNFIPIYPIGCEKYKYSAGSSMIHCTVNKSSYVQHPHGTTQITKQMLCAVSYYNNNTEWSLLLYLTIGNQRYCLYLCRSKHPRWCREISYTNIINCLWWMQWDWKTSYSMMPIISLHSLPNPLHFTLIR